MQDDLITVDEHEEISLQSERSKTTAAERLLVAVERSGSLKLLSILRSYDAGGLADRLQLQAEEIKINVDKGVSFSGLGKDYQLPALSINLVSR